MDVAMNPCQVSSVVYCLLQPPVLHKLIFRHYVFKCGYSYVSIHSICKVSFFIACCMLFRVLDS